MTNFEGNRGTKTILGNREHKKTNFRFLGNSGTSHFISGEQGNRYPPGRASLTLRMLGIFHALLFRLKEPMPFQNICSDASRVQDCWNLASESIRDFNGHPGECRTKHPGTKHPMPFFDIPDKTSRIDLPPRTKHPMQFLSPRTKHPMPFLPPRTKHPMPFLPPRTKHPTLCLKPMTVHKTSHLVNCHYD